MGDVESAPPREEASVPLLENVTDVTDLGSEELRLYGADGCIHECVSLVCVSASRAPSATRMCRVPQRSSLPLPSPRPPLPSPKPAGRRGRRHRLGAPASAGFGLAPPRRAFKLVCLPAPFRGATGERRAG